MYSLSKNRISSILLLSPALIIYAVFSIIPLTISFTYSFLDWNGVNDKAFIGLANYVELFKDSVFYTSLKNTLIIVLFSLVVQMAFSFILAEILNKNLKGSNFFKIVFFLPVVISTVIVALMWTFILNPNEGVLNLVLRSIGLERFAFGWIGDKNLSIFSVAFVNTWQYVGVSTVIFLAGLKSIPAEIHEACMIDGATTNKEIFAVTIPLLKESLKTNIVLSTIGSLKTFDLVYALTNGGPGHGSDVMATYMYKQAFIGLRFGYGVTISIIIFLLSAMISIAFLRITQSKTE